MQLSAFALCCIPKIKMSIKKLFIKVFGEDIFKVLGPEDDEEAPDEATKRGGCDGLTLPDQLSYCRQMILVKSWLKGKLDDIKARCHDAVVQQQLEMRSRLGPEYVIFDIDFSSTARVANDRLSVRSQGSFNTIKANACVFGGRWMYEVQLHSKGVMQVGWCSKKCVFNENSGVGDSKLSYGYDGSKQQSWHISTAKYGEKWQIGDIIGVTLDIEQEEITYYRNGISMGVAFSKLEKGPGITFFPAISLGYNQSVQANFGNSPFKYPVADYKPLMAVPIVNVQRAELLLGYLMNMSTIVARYNSEKSKKPKEDKLSTKKTVYVVFCTLIIEHLSPLLFNSYVIESKLLDVIRHACNLRNDSDAIQPGHSESVLGALLDILWNYMEVEEMKYILKKLANALLSDFTQTNKALDYGPQRLALQTLIGLCNHTRTRKIYLEYKFFKKHFLALLMYIRPPEFSYMQTLIPDHLAWTEGIGGPKSKYLAAVEQISKSTDFVYALQKTLLLSLLTNDDGDMVSSSSRKIFLAKLRRYVMDLSMEQRPYHTLFFMQSSILHPIENTVALAFICILIDVTKTAFEREIASRDIAISPTYFYDGSFEYQHFDRVGGVLSHLRKVHRNDIQQHLGVERTQELLEDDRVIVRVTDLTAESITNVSMAGGPLSNSTALTTLLNPRLNQVFELKPGNSNTEASLYDLLDLCVLYYYCVGHKYIVKIASVRDEIAALNDVLLETKFYREDVEKKLQVLEDHASVCMDEQHSHVVSELRTKFSQRENVFAKRSIELARKQAWYRAVALGPKRRKLLTWLLDKALRTLNASSKEGPLFSFVPEVYINILPILLDTVMDFSNHDLLVQFEIQDSECVIDAVANFLSIHSADSRIVLASCKDSLLQALGTLTCHKAGIQALERAPRKSQVALAKALLRPYENRAWGQSNWLILRFWLGQGFAYRDARQPCVWQGGNTPLHFGLCRSRSKNETHTGLLHNIAPANPSKHFQELIGLKLTEDEPLATAFLNSVLSQLNWAFSEFILLLQEIQNTAHRQENTIFEPKQLKICSMCFELTVSLMRCLEMIITVAPDIFHDPCRANSDLVLNRVCQLISQVLSRVTVPPGCFQFVVDMCSADLNAVTHFPIITAALGILLALFKDEMDSDKSLSKVTRISRALLTDPSFQFANLEFAMGEIKTPILQQSEIPRGNFDPSTRAHIDPLTNDVRIPQPTTSTSKKIRADPPILKFSLADFPTHVTPEETEKVKRLIDMLKAKQSLLSDITLPSEDSLCPICCAKPIAVVFTPCKHQSCRNCILQHLMNSKVCFYCKTLIKTIETSDGSVVYQNAEYLQTPTLFEV
ncbi:E3 ubiquitin-protein ligase RNF123 isoform X2 [Stomoxys calcitrans]|uniref:E3 ubiquitin-protein ligase RNF123 isoform X2 n=1 Tax=Stomoxys calcitrans TaxID=35570 RepID=UPI0027E36479|nr:E3 ubiquitin-protein ligase RNF123 isoform X2 [Stomoxys calcitrans]